MAKKSEFKRLTKLEKGLPKSGRTFIAESGAKGLAVAAWYKGDIGSTKNYVVVLYNEVEDTYDVVTLVEGTPKVQACENLYQAFLAHKEARFA